MSAVTPSGLMWQLDRSARQRGHKQLFCAPDVLDVIIGRAPPAGPRPPLDPFGPGMVMGMLAVDLVVTPDAPPGTFRLVRHYDPAARQVTCEVHGDTVSHWRCPVVLEGTLVEEG